MNEYDFTLILSGINDFDEAQIDALMEAGCDDATVAQRDGRVYMKFSREASSMMDAIISAICDIRKAKIGADVLRVDSCNLVTLAEIARRLNQSRQWVDNYARGKRGDGSFPPPACNLADGYPLYYWCDVSYWAMQMDLLTQDDVRDTEEIAVINTHLEVIHHKRMVPDVTNRLNDTLRISDCCQ